MDRKKVTETIFQYPESYLQTQKRILDERINNVQLTDEEHKKIVVDTNSILHH